MDRLSRRTDPLGKAETFAYDGNGNLTSTTDRKNQTTTFTYDALNRRTQTSYQDGSSATFTYDAGSRLTQVNDTADPHRPITLAYDPLDRLLSETTALGSVTYTYDTAGRRTTMAVSGQAPVTYTYDHNSRLRTITRAPLNPVDIQYDAANRRTVLTLPNGVSTEYQYDLASRLTALIYRNALGPLGDLTYQYDAAGNRISTGGSFARTLVPEAVPTSTYDQGNRQLAFGASTLTYDDNGNRLTQTDPSGTITYAWDARNRLIGISGPGVGASFAYDGLGRRAQKTVNSVLTQFHYDGLDAVRESSSGSDAAYLRTLSIDEALARTDAVDTVHHLGDALGSSVALTDPAGVAATTYTYEPFGRTEIAGTPNPNVFRFTGREDDGTGLYYYRARYYDPTRSRFVGEDPIGLAGGINVFSYVKNDPLGSVDPFGLDDHHKIPKATWRDKPLKPEVRAQLNKDIVDAGNHNYRHPHSELNERVEQQWNERWKDTKPQDITEKAMRDFQKKVNSDPVNKRLNREIIRRGGGNPRLIRCLGPLFYIEFMFDLYLTARECEENPCLCIPNCS